MQTSRSAVYKSWRVRGIPDGYNVEEIRHIRYYKAIVLGSEDPEFLPEHAIPEDVVLELQAERLKVEGDAVLVRQLE